MAQLLNLSNRLGRLLLELEGAAFSRNQSLKCADPNPLRIGEDHDGYNENRDGGLAFQEAAELIAGYW